MLLEAAQDRWRRVAGPELIALVRAGVKFIDGQLVERDDTTTEKDNEVGFPPAAGHLG